MEPLASQLRPVSLADFYGQTHLVGEDKPLRIAIEKKQLFSFILWGPPGVGKTTLARIYAKALNAEFFELSAVSSGKEDLKKIIGDQKNLTLNHTPKILFLDEIHRFNKSQQDYLLPFVESGKLVLIGATTENPSFEVVAPLLSRCRVFTLHELNQVEIEEIINRVEKLKGIKIARNAKDWLFNFANGDARLMLTQAETTLNLYGKITVDTLAESIQNKFLRYDKKGDEHYNTISAFIKSMRASQVDSALYYLARMIKAGEDPKFIARRMIIFASEDIGLAQPTALVVANAVFDAVARIGLPEAGINLAHGVAYLAEAKKNRDAYDAYNLVMAEVNQSGNLPIPLKIRNATSKLTEELGYHKDYKLYPKESLLPEKLQGKKYFPNKQKKVS